MSSITFPGGTPSYHHASAAAFDHPDPQSHTPSFDNVSDVFRMNPLSHHPPRTPRQSVTASSASAYGVEAYNPLDETPETKELYEEDSEDEDDKARTQAEGKVKKEEIWRDLLTTSNGRDKTLVRSHSSHFRLITLNVLMHVACTENHAVLSATVPRLPQWSDSSIPDEE